MISITDGSVDIQTTSESNLSTPGWFGETKLRVYESEAEGGSAGARASKAWASMR